MAKITPEDRRRMYCLLDLYQKEYDPTCPVVCVDEKSKQLLEELRTPIAMKPDRIAKQDADQKLSKHYAV